EIIETCQKEIGWLYETNHTEKLLIENNKGFINYIIWSDVFICPNCNKEFVFWDSAIDFVRKTVSDSFHCSNCGLLLNKTKCLHSTIKEKDINSNKIIEIIKQVPVLINYSFNGKRYEKKPDKEDLLVIEKLNNQDYPLCYPTYRMPIGEESRRNDRIGFFYINHFFTKRTLIALSCFYNKIKNNQKMLFLFTSILQRASKLFKWSKNQAGPLSGTLYISSCIYENSIFYLINNKRKLFEKWSMTNKQCCINCSSLTNLSNFKTNSIDYIFTDPPFGDNLMYSELNFIWESWLKVKTNNKCEAIINESQKKGLHEYQDLMTKCFSEYYRVLKPNRWMTVEFHNSKNAVWNAIQEAILRAGFVIADVRTLDKQQGSFKQVTTSSAVKQDLVISAYKPKESLKRKMLNEAGSEETAWAFVRQHLENLPVVVVKNNKIEVIAERQAYLLFDRMVAYHIMHGLPVPLDASDFYKGLKTRKELLERDGMYFLSSQVNEYDAVRVKTDLENIDFSLFVTNEKSAIGWLYRQLSEKDGNAPQTYAELQPKFMQELKAVDKYEAIPELSVLLQDNFLKDDETGKWRIPDPTKEADVRKLREKNLLKEFETYRASKGKLKSFRSEAIRVGFAHLWKEKNYNAIVEMGKRLPESIIQEDSKLLMYYDNSLSKADTYEPGEQMKLKIEK
ncbi:MAG: DNA methylase, partial [Candidatus Riflebacteria bacterium]|nr:DNA methylase [Candidatus Riflebacteria bacterium]